jgi:hypothetical protein
MKPVAKKPMPVVHYDGHTYTLTSRKTIIPDFEAMRHMDALVWLARNTRRRGYQKEQVRLPAILAVK